MKKMIFIVLGSITMLCTFGMLGYRALAHSIRNQRTCEWANIDNIEIHAHIDVPRVVKWDCNYEKTNNIKKASFTIDRSKVDLDKYSRGYKLQKLNDSTEIAFARFLHLDPDSLIQADLYYKSRQADGERADVLYDKNSGRLWVTIEYKD